MKLPNYREAIIPLEKITEYLLSFIHRDGRGKARFFYQHGFSAERWDEFESALHKHLELNDVAVIEETKFGVRYVVEGYIDTPEHKRVLIRSVWFIEAEESSPHLVTAYPLRGE